MGLLFDSKTFFPSLRNIMAINIFLIMLLFYFTFARITDNMDYSDEEEITEVKNLCFFHLSYSQILSLESIFI